MRRLVLIGTVLAIGLGLYAVNPPRFPDAPAGEPQAASRAPAQSMVSRLAEAGLAMRRQAAPEPGYMPTDHVNGFFGPK